jgi:pimeloyl-ACP methyl ester carboxylesterase
MKVIRFLLILVASLSPQLVVSAPPGDAAYLDGEKSLVGIVLVHGRGMDPDGFVIGPLRKALNGTKGYHTIALRLLKTTSVESVTKEQKIAEMKAIFPVSRDMIQVAVEFLRDERGVRHVYVVGHSMGATIAATLVAQGEAKGFSGLIVIGAGDYEEPPFDTTANLGKISKSAAIPVLDVYGDTNGIRHPVDLRLATDDMRLGELRKAYVSATYRQKVIESGGHVFYRDGVQNTLTEVVSDWIAARENAASK